MLTQDRENQGQGKALEEMGSSKHLLCVGFWGCKPARSPEQGVQWVPVPKVLCAREPQRGGPSLRFPKPASEPVTSAPTAQHCTQHPGSLGVQ